MPNFKSIKELVESLTPAPPSEPEFPEPPEPIAVVDIPPTFVQVDTTGVVDSTGNPA